MLDGLVITRRFDTPAWLSALVFLAGIAAGLAMATSLLVAIGVPASALFDEVIGEAFMTASGLAQTLTFATPLICVGLSAAVALRLRFWNIGIEGQLWLGALGATAIALGDVGPEATRLPLMLVAAALAGSAWIALPLVLKLRLGVNEVITTLLLGSIAFLFAQHLLFGAWRDPATGFPISLAFDAAERLAALGFGRTHLGLPIALTAALLVWFLVDVTRLGFYGRAVGENIEAARAAGVPVIAVTCAFVLLSGALSGLAGGLIVAGTEHRMSLTLGAGYTFSGIVIAFLGRFRPLATVVVAVIIGGVFTASDVFKVFYGISEAVVVLLQGLVLFGVLVAQFFGAYRISRANWGGTDVSGFLVGWLAAIPAYAAPLLLAALGLILSERAGVLNLSAEGVMALGAMTGAAVVLSGIAPTLGILAGIAAGAGLSLVFAIVVVVFRGDQTLAGLTTVAVGIGLAGVLGRDFVQKPFPGIERFGADAAPATGAFERFFLQQDPLVLVALVLVVAVWWFLERTRAGLQLRAVGEDPGTADVAGVDVQMVRIAAVVAGGALCGLSGAYLSVAASHVWVEGMIAGRGWIAVALVIFARWDARRALLGALIFGAAEALGPRLQAVGAPVPTYLMMMLPYALTLIVLVLSSLIGRRDTAEPAALGSIYLRQDKS